MIHHALAQDTRRPGERASMVAKLPRERMATLTSEIAKALLRSGSEGQGASDHVICAETVCGAVP